MPLVFFPAAISSFFRPLQTHKKTPRSSFQNQAASHHGHQQQQQPQGQGFEGSELRVTNLAFKVTEADVRELFSAIGRLRRTAVDRRPNGESAGAASVAYYNAADCDRAIRTYDGVALDGQPMRLALGAGAVAALSSGLTLSRVGAPRGAPAGGRGGYGPPPPGYGAPVQRRVVAVGGPRVVAVAVPPRGAGGLGAARGGFGRGGGRGGGARVKSRVVRVPAASASELDSQLDTYMKG